MPGKNSPARLLVLMAKEPVPGQTKTRLIPALGGEAAAGLYAAFLQDKVAQMRLVPEVARAIAYHPLEAQGFFSELARDFILIEQRGDSLAERLVNVFRDAFTDGYARVMAIDGDTPHLPPEYLSSGFDALEHESKEVVIGPSKDGGYYAIGMKEPHEYLFDIEMSTPHVTGDTLARAQEGGLQVHLLPEWWDIDELADLQRLDRWLKGDETREGTSAISTEEFLAELQIG